MHPIRKCNHEENRRKKCASCGRRINFRKYASEYQITERFEKLIKSHINKDFGMDQPKFPLSICTSCCLSLLSREKNHSERPLPVMPNYLDILLLDDVICYCYICLTGQSTGHLKPRSSRRNLQNHRVTIGPSNGPYGWLNVPRVSEANKKNSRGRKSISKGCDECHQIVGRGIRHACKANGSNARDNCINLLKNLPKNKENQVVMNVLSNFQNNTGVSTNHTGKMVNFLRSHAGRASVPGGPEKELS
ncbi:hypothetical protein QAD02_013564 [Eretmocerus hayati]|uniref:Uncharacterized protein n=1 Tax=Eretmocerus hayati TaxID=131215 RepID=A0ACC2P320_9HYME|nr:hypothetical protein QAD02_013564 [Eretmocerus hayati]